MKVKNLIKNLSNMNPEAEVKLHHHLGTKALFVLTLQNDDSVVWLEDKNDIDIREELYVRYKECEPDKKKELYYELLEMGFEESDINEYIPEIFNPYNCCELSDYAPTLTAQGDSITKSGTVLIICEDNE